MANIPISEFIIRKSKSDDAEKVAFINSQSWQTTYRGIIDPAFLETITPEQQLPRARRLVESSELCCLVAQNKQTGEIAGFACFGKNREPKVDADCELQAIYLLEEFQNYGIGKMLFDFGVKELKKQLKTKMMVSVFEANRKARSFYERQGAQQIESDRVDLAGIRYTTSTYIWNLNEI